MNRRYGRNGRKDQRIRKTVAKQGVARNGGGKKYAAPETADQYFRMAERSQDEWNRVVHVISKMRTDHTSLRKASQEFGVSSSRVIQLARAALRKRKNGRYGARTSDQLLRVLVVPTSTGPREIAVRGSQQATLLGQYWAALQKYLETGDDSALRKIRRKQITDASGRRVPLIKDVRELDRLGSAGVLSFESLYAKVA